MGRASRDRGAKIERALVAAPQAMASRPNRWFSGAARGRFGGDVSAPLLGLDRRVQVKGHAGGVARLYGWPTGADVLVIEADGKEPLVALPLRLAAEVAGAVERSGEAGSREACPR